MTVLYQPMFRVKGATTFLPFAGLIPSVSVAITGLSPTTSYDFEVVASNSFGSATSAIVNASTTALSGAPLPGSVGGTQASGSADPVISGPSSGTVLISGSLGITGITVSDAASLAATSGVIWKTTTYTKVSTDGLTLSLAASTDGNTVYPFYGATTISSNKYWEVVITTPSSSTGSAFGLSPVAGDGTPAASAGVLQWHQDGSLWADGGYQNLGGPGTWPTYSSGARLCFAVDVSNAKLYGRVGAGGSWNKSTSANPVTNTGGLAIPTSILTGGGAVGSPQMVVGGVLYQNNSSVLACFTSSSFVGTPPTGFAPIPSAGPTTVTFTTTAGTLSTTVGGVAVPGSGTASITYVNTLANVQTAMANLVLTASVAAATTANVKVAVFDPVNATNSITIPIGIVAGTIPSPPTSLVVS